MANPIDQLHTRGKDSIGMTSHPVAPSLPCILQSRAKSAGRRFEVAKLYPSHNLSDHSDKQETWMLKTVYAEYELVEVRTRTMRTCYIHKHTATFCQVLLHSWIVILRK